MTAPLFLLEPGELDGVGSGAAVLLEGGEGRHAATVLRLRVGERVDVCDTVGAVARCTVREVVTTGGGRAAGLLLEVASVEKHARPDPTFVLVQALAKGGRDELAVETATELGVDEVVPWQAARSVVVWRGARGEKARGSWVATARAAAKQSRRPWVPVVAPVVAGAALAERVRAAELAVVLHEEATSPLAGLRLPEGGEVLLVVGPEGGLAPGELSDLLAAGAVPARLGEPVLRSSTAGPAALAVLSAARRWR